MGDGYTELFFLDEPTALAAGHRPCFLCRRAAATAFAAAWARAAGLDAPPRAPEMDAVLHRERILRPGRGKRRTTMRLGDLPSGAMAAWDDAVWLTETDGFRRWTPAGYDAFAPREDAPLDAGAQTLTPPSIVAALRAGYAPLAAAPSVAAGAQSSARQRRR